MRQSLDCDVAVVGAGPAGLSAAHAAATAGARVIVLERAEHPRYKTCGGGLLGTSMRLSVPTVEVPARDRIHAVTFTHDGRRPFTRLSPDEPVVTMVRRSDFDQAWCRAAVQAGAAVRENTLVRAVNQDDRTATVVLACGSSVTASVVIGADGSAGVTARHVGVTFDQQDLGLEVELAATSADQARWRGRLLVDWGRVPGSYGWLFPKEDQLTVGVIMERGRAAETKRYLRDFVARLGLSGRRVLRDSGHLTRCRSLGAPVRRGRVLVAGDAAGLLEPWTREGISYALRSGKWAGTVAARHDDLAEYDRLIATGLSPEMAAGRRLLGLFGRHPGLVHALMASPPGWRVFAAFCRGEVSLARVLRHRAVRAAVTLLSAPGR
ncbi:geranylgeranyl reductase family protein [Actinoplanes couchii]|uniref:geranylgeranyl reductase family protein n=1 Tax=Actinoplanes couchii TaxID=403638 RepID=UPI001EF17B8D|nr:geranylgeranyl reductase family protein [Actinoplanes couchii]MDR6323848.1 geranylgeranyl reductase family protein [Actinoplanes couchii]